MLLTDLFAASVARYPERPAVDVPPGRGRPQREVTTYAGLARLQADVAGALLPLVGDESLVVLALPRNGAALYAAMLGVLEAGAAYVGADPAFPDAHFAPVVPEV
jgi:non-ribosomal peptide synthetase component F